MSANQKKMVDTNETSNDATTHQKEGSEVSA